MTVILKERIKILLMFFKSFIRTKILKYPVLYNVKKSRHKKRVLLAYLVPPFLGKLKNMHHNEIRNLLIANALDKAGFTIDVINVRAPQKPKIKKYDMIIGEWIDFKIKLNINDSVKIFFASGKDHREHNQTLKRRYEMLMRRRNVKLNPLGLLPERMPYVEVSNYIIGIGNRYTINKSYERYSNIKKIFTLNNHIYKDTKVIRKRKPESKNNFHVHIVFYTGKRWVGSSA